MIDTARPQPKSPLQSQPRLLANNSSSRRTCLTSRTKEAQSLPESHSQPEPFLPSKERAASRHDLEIAKRILLRIESRLPGRVRELTVYSTENSVVLTGTCCTFYTKQLAQHIAMGVLEYEQLVNNIDVRVTK